jgi:hypothetical protein
MTRSAAVTGLRQAQKFWSACFRNRARLVGLGPRTQQIPISACFRACRDVTQAGFRQCRATGFFLLFSFGVQGSSARVSLLHGDGLDGFGDVSACLQAACGWLPGEGNPVLAQVPDHVPSTGWRWHFYPRGGSGAVCECRGQRPSAADAARAAAPGCGPSGRKHSSPGLGQAGRRWCGRGGGAGRRGLAAGPGLFHAPPAGPVGQQPG